MHAPCNTARRRAPETAPSRAEGRIPGCRPRPGPAARCGDRGARLDRTRRPSALAFAGACACAWLGAAQVAHAQVPEVFAPGVISRAAHEAAPAFTPDGRTVYFQRSNPAQSTILGSHLGDGAWSTPVVAPFSGTWNDMEPAMAPDGSYMIFVSSRPITRDGKPIDGFFNGKRQPGQGGNLWRVDRRPGGWGAPQRLPAVINAGTTVFAPSIARDGSLYFMHPDPKTGRFRLYRAQWRDGSYQAPQPLPFSTGASTDVDPAVDPDERFLVFGSGRAPASGMDLFIVFRGRKGWGTPVHMGDSVNAPGSDAEPRLSPDGRTLYFSSERLVPSHFPRTREQAEHDNEAAATWNNGQYNIWYVDLAAWRKQHPVGDR